jgi:transposase
MTKRTPPYSPEVRERTVRMVFDHQDEYTSQYEAIRSIAAKIGCSGEALRHWVRQAERNQSLPPRADDPGAEANQGARA